MNIFFEPVNLNQWNMFEKVSMPGHIEPFLATKSMEVGDLMLLHVGQQNKMHESGVYAIGRIVKGPYILTGHPDDYCNNKNTVDVEILKMDYSSPIISHTKCKDFIHQFRTVHIIDAVHHKGIMVLLGDYETNETVKDEEAAFLIGDDSKENLQKLINAFKKKLPSVKSKEDGLEKLRQGFVKDFNLNKLSKMTKEEYVIGLDSKDSFCYRIERELQEYGDMRGATSAKFGLYFGKIGEDTEKKYRSTSKYSDDPDKAIIEIRNQIGCLYLDGANKNYQAIKDSELSPMFKGKILAMYFPEDYLCIYSEEHINHFINSLNIQTVKTATILDKQIKLIEWKNSHGELKNWSNYVFAVFLYDAFGRPFTSAQVKKDLQAERDEKYPRDYVSKVGISISKWKELLDDPDVFTSENIELLKRFYVSDNHATTCYDLGIQDGISPTSYISPVVALGKRILKATNSDPINNDEGKIVWWRVIFWGRYREDGKFEWKLRPKLAKAMADLYPELEVTISEVIESREDDELINDLKNISSIKSVAEYTAEPKKKDTPIFVEGHKTYPRDRQVALNALALANYECEINREHTTFIRKNTDKKYTEPHHLIPLSYSDEFSVSLDVEANIVSLCSNCHNHIHYGQGAEALIELLYESRKESLNSAGIYISLEQLLAMYGYK